MQESEIQERESSETEMIRRSNNKEGTDFLIIVHLNETAEDVSEQVSNWVINKCLDKIEHPIIYSTENHDDEDNDDENNDDENKDEPSTTFSWRIVSNIYNNDFENEEDEIHNEIWFAVHFDNKQNILFEHKKDKEGLIIINEDIEPTVISSEFMLKHFTDEPDCVIGLGVSAVSCKFMKEIWYEIVSEGKLVDGEAKGHLSHPMWIKKSDNQWEIKSEDSNTFGWSDYPPGGDMFPFPKLF